MREELAELAEVALRLGKPKRYDFGRRLRREVQSLLDNANIARRRAGCWPGRCWRAANPGSSAGLAVRRRENRGGAGTAAAGVHQSHAHAQAGIEWHLLDLLRQAADGSVCGARRSSANCRSGRL